VDEITTRGGDSLVYILGLHHHGGVHIPVRPNTAEHMLERYVRRERRLTVVPRGLERAVPELGAELAPERGGTAERSAIQSHVISGYSKLPDDDFHRQKDAVVCLNSLLAFAVPPLLSLAVNPKNLVRKVVSRSRYETRGCHIRGRGAFHASVRVMPQLEAR
jgi:hypothetical protein